MLPGVRVLTVHLLLLHSSTGTLGLAPVYHVLVPSASLFQLSYSEPDSACVHLLVNLSAFFHLALT